MRATWDELPTVVMAEHRRREECCWGALLVSRDRIAAGGTPRGAEGPYCGCAHWGYLRAGRLRVRYGDHEELITAGDLYYVAPRHVVLVEQDCDLVEVAALTEWLRAVAGLTPGSGKCFIELPRETDSKEEEP